VRPHPQLAITARFKENTAALQQRRGHGFIDAPMRGALELSCDSTEERETFTLFGLID
jgi:hypothetical protein